MKPFKKNGRSVFDKKCVVYYFDHPVHNEVFIDTINKMHLYEQ